jgi:uncharacterized protein YprB with RNaseH-like and TPR domain
MNHFFFFSPAPVQTPQGRRVIAGSADPPKLYHITHADGTVHQMTLRKKTPPTIKSDEDKTDREIIKEVLYNITSAIITVNYPKNISWNEEDKTVHETWSKEDYDRTRIEVDPLNRYDRWWS